ncbi:MAG: Conserved putative rane protein [Nocardioides sp.]|nr:Conserved putative rane protein [Nocardioides sp.]
MTAGLLARAAALLPRPADLRAMGRRPGRDAMAGVTVALVALPLALAFGISSGLGAEAGLVTAVVAGVLAALFGGSAVQVSGPTGAMTVVLVPIVAAHGADGVLVVGLMAGVILVGLALSGAGRYIRFVPLPVVEGFTIGIALIIALQQVPSMLGVAGSGDQVVAAAADAVRRWAGQPHAAPLLMAAGVAGAMLLGRRFRPGLPVSLLAVVGATGVAAAAHLSLTRIGHLPTGLPAPGLPHLATSELGGLLVPAVAVAALAALESLLSASVSDAMRVGERHDPDRELFGQGLANLAVPFFGGVPATAAIARTAVNVRAGAHSRLAAVVQSLAILLMVLVASRWVSEIPLAALAGVLVATAVQMIEVSSVRALLTSTRGDAVVLLVTAGTTLALDLVTAVLAGLVAAGVFALVQMARSVSLETIPLDRGEHAEEERSLLDDHIVAFRLEGPLFFGAAHSFLLQLSEVSDVRVVVLRMSGVATLDATGAAVLADTIKRLEARGITVLLSGVRPAHEQVLVRLGVYGELAHERHLFASTPEAIAHARVHAARIAHEPVDRGLGATRS